MGGPPKSSIFIGFAIEYWIVKHGKPPISPKDLDGFRSSWLCVVGDFLW